MDVLKNNPYRLLGVYANSSVKERLANLSRMKAFLKVGKQVTFPLDLADLLGEVERTDTTVAEADAKLTLPKDQLFYAQFWFVKATPIDDVAFNNLTSGNKAKAVEIWQKKECASSLQNQILCALLNSDYALALSLAEDLYGSEVYFEEFKSLVDSNVGLGNAELAFQFLDTLSDEVGVAKLLPLISNEAWKKHLGDKAVQPLLDSIQQAIEESKKTKGKGFEERYEAGIKLMNSTKSVLAQLGKLLSKQDMQYQTIADKLGGEILQCGIDYYNGAKNPMVARKSAVLQEYANSVVVGHLAKGRCEENCKILKEIIEKLPPEEVMEEDKAIQLLLLKFTLKPDLIEHSIQLIKDCAPHIVSIKEKLGREHPYYLKMSTLIVNNALSNVIAEVNEAQENAFNFEKLKSTLISAWRTQLYMDKFDLEPTFKEGRYKQSRDALHSIIENCKGFESYVFSSRYKYGCGWCNGLNVEDVELRTDDEVYSSCKNIVSYKAYLKKFPKGKHKDEARNNVEKLSYENATTISALFSFIGEYPQSEYVAQANVKIAKLKKEEEKKKEEAKFNSCVDEKLTLEKGINACKEYLSEYPNGKYKEEVSKTLSSLQEKKLIRLISAFIVHVLFIMLAIGVASECRDDTNAFISFLIIAVLGGVVWFVAKKDDEDIFDKISELNGCLILIIGPIVIVSFLLYKITKGIVWCGFRFCKFIIHRFSKNN